jgi:hypothetical protein
MKRALRQPYNFRRRLQQYRKMIREMPAAIRVVAEGDSWFQHPLVEDILDHLSNHVAVYSIGAAGDELRNMFRENEYFPAVKSQGARYLLLSGGGNDLLGPMFKNYINDFATETSSHDLINAECRKKISDMENIYDILLSHLSNELPDVRVLIHGYDYVIPREGRAGRWVGRVLTARGITAGPMRRTIVAQLIDRFNESIASLAARHRNLVYVDARKAVSETQWYDEIHPDSSGFQQVAICFLRHLQ